MTDDETNDTFSDEERAAIKERAAELKKQRRPAKGKVDGETDVLEKIAELDPADRAIAERLHALVKEAAPGLAPKTWYGMPGYAKDGKVLIFFQSAAKFKTRYSTLGFNDNAQLDDGDHWPTAYGISALTPAVEKQIAALVKKAAG